jgi:hypothetical protein
MATRNVPDPNWIDDPSALLGYAKLLNQETVNPQIDAVDIEREILEANFTVPDNDGELLDGFAEKLQSIAGLSQTSPKAEDKIPNISTMFANQQSDNESESDEQEQYEPVHQPHSYEQSYSDPILSRMTTEQMQRRIISKTIGGTSNNASTNLAREVIGEEERIEWLERITNLHSQLRANGEPLDDIPIPSRDADIGSVRDTLELLERRNRRRQMATLSEYAILSIISVFEKIFNGERVILGTTPNLSGYSDHVRFMLRNNRHITSQVALDTVGDINPLTLLCIEIFGGMFMHMKLKSGAVTEDKVTSQEFARAISEINAAAGKK